ncbi:MAG TPA: hypothetical protein VFZ97_20090 [Acidimicrobiales bacterium]
MSVRLDDTIRGPREQLARKATQLRAAAHREREAAARARAAAKAECLDSIGLMRRARQLFFDRHGTLVSAWSGEPGPQRAPVQLVDGHANSAGLRTAIDHLFNVTADLSSVVTLNEDAEIDRRLRRIIDQTEQVITWVRVAVTEDRPPPSGNHNGDAGDRHEAHPPGVTCERCGSVISVAEAAHPTGMGRWVHTDCPDPGGTVEVVQVGESLRQASHVIDADLDSALANRDPVAVDLSEASQALHRALIALDTTLVKMVKPVV